MKKVFIFPGQGSQYVGMGKILYQKLDYAKKIYNHACDILEYDIKEISFTDKNNLLNETKYTQPAIFIYSVILDYILKDNNIFPDAVAGHSLGEITALKSNKCLNFENALLLIKNRAQCMYNEGIKKPGKMIAVIDRNRNRIEELLKKEKNICIANYNSPKQIILSGTINKIENFIKIAKKEGIKRIIPLKVSGAFHSHLMNDSRNKLSNIINSIKFNQSKIPIYQNFDPIKKSIPEEIKNNLIKQIDNAVRWEEIILNLHNDKFDFFIEVGPNNILTKLNIDIVSNAKIKYIENMKCFQKFND